MSPTILRERGYRFFFFSREETRPHIHIYCGDGEAKFWLDPQIELARNYRLSKVQLREIEAIIEAHYDELKAAWNEYFGT
jgi:hypothetical protein